MKITGADIVPYPAERVWAALLDPRVLVTAIPGCSRLEVTGEHEYAMTVTAGVAAVKGTYDGSCSLHDLREPESLTMRLRGAGAPGTIDATVAVRFVSQGDGSTEIAYDADAIVGGMVGGVGQRMLVAVSRRTAGEFFGNISAALAAPSREVGVALTEEQAPRPSAEAGERPLEGSRTQAPPGTVFTPPPKPRSDFARGVAVGAGLVLLGVVAGAVLGRRR